MHARAHSVLSWQQNSCTKAIIAKVGPDGLFGRPDAAYLSFATLCALFACETPPQSQLVVKSKQNRPSSDDASFYHGTGF